MGKDVIIACDFAGKDEALAFLDKFPEEKPYVKIGMELFTPPALRSCGRSRPGATRSSWI